MTLTNALKYSRLWGVLTLCLGVLALSTSALRAQDIEFGPGIRSIDFDDIFDRSVPAHAAAWDSLYASGVRTIVLSQGLISPYAPNHKKRPVATYMSAAALANMRQTLNRGPGPRDDFHVTYIAGYGLGAQACKAGSTPQKIALAAADWEFSKIIRRVLDSGVPIRTLDVDGVFLRVIKSSKKAHSCALAKTGGGYSADTSAQIGLDYLKRLRDLINAHPTQRKAGLQVDVTLLINLPNWRVGSFPALKSAGNTGDLVTDMLAAFGKAMQADTDRPLSLSGAVIDYPFPHARNNPKAFRAKTAALLNGLKALPRTKARLTFITNTNYTLTPQERSQRYRGFKGTVACVWGDNWSISGGSLPYLPYENAQGVQMPATCLAQQTAADARYWEESARFANRISSGAWRGRGVRQSDVAAYRFQSWHEMPARSLFSMSRTRDYKLYRK